MAYLLRTITSTGTTSATVTYPIHIFPGDIIVVTQLHSDTSTISYSDGGNTFTAFGGITSNVVQYSAYSIATTFRPSGTNLSMTWGGTTKTPTVVTRIFRPEPGEFFIEPSVVGANGAMITTLTTTSDGNHNNAQTIFLGASALTELSGVTGDSDTLGNSWSNVQTHQTNAGAIAYQHKITSNPDAQTFNPTWTSTKASQSLISIPVNIHLKGSSISSINSSMSQVNFQPIIFGSSKSNGQAILRREIVITEQLNASSVSSARNNIRLQISPISAPSTKLYTSSASSGNVRLSVNHSGRNSLSAKSNGSANNLVSVNYNIQNINASSKSNGQAILRRKIVITEQLNASSVSSAVFREKTIFSISSIAIGNSSAVLDLAVINVQIFFGGQKSGGKVNLLGSEVGPFIGWGVPI